MDYSLAASSNQPGLALILLDVSEGLLRRCGPHSWAEVVAEALGALPAMAASAVGRDGLVSASRFKVALVAYSNKPFKATGFIWAHRLSGAPEIKPGGKANAFDAFRTALELLRTAVASAPSGPAPLLCHLTTGRYAAGGSPAPVLDRIRALRTADGPVVVLQLFLRATSPERVGTDLVRWPGVREPEEVDGLYADPGDVEYARELVALSSRVPAPFLPFLRQGAGACCLSHDARLFFPVGSPAALKLALQAALSSGSPPRDFAPGRARLVCVRGALEGKPVLLPEVGLVTFGRSPGHSVILPDAGVSRDHAILEAAGGRCTIGEWPGRPGAAGVAIVRDGMVSEVRRHDLAPGEHLVLGDTEFRFEILG